jgi:hypothetical protein
MMIFSATCTEAGLLGYGICQAGCAGSVVACYSVGGYIFGTVTGGTGAPAAALTCNAAFGKCQAACVAAGLSPIL